MAPHLGALLDLDAIRISCGIRLGAELCQKYTYICGYPVDRYCVQSTLRWADSGHDPQYISHLHDPSIQDPRPQNLLELINQLGMTCFTCHFSRPFRSYVFTIFPPLVCLSLPFSLSFPFSFSLSFFLVLFPCHFSLFLCLLFSFSSSSK